MNKQTTPDGRIILELSDEEVMAFSNCLNETLEALQDWEFETRVGVNRGFILNLMRQLAPTPDSPPSTPRG